MLKGDETIMNFMDTAVKGLGLNSTVNCAYQELEYYSIKILSTVV